jgi:hypothetical protein
MCTKMGNLIYFVLDWQAQSQPSLARYNCLVCTMALIHTSDTILHSPIEAWQGSTQLFWTAQPSLAGVNYLVCTLSLIRKILDSPGTAVYGTCTKFTMVTMVRRPHPESRMHWKKGLRYSHPSRDVTNQTLPSPWSGIIKLFPARESLVSDIPAGDRKIANLFYSVGTFWELTYPGQAGYGWWRMVEYIMLFHPLELTVNRGASITVHKSCHLLQPN